MEASPPNSRERMVDGCSLHNEPQTQQQSSADDTRNMKTIEAEAPETTYSSSSNGTTVVLFGSSWGECGYCQGARASLVNRPESESSRSYTILVINSTLDAAWYESLVYQGWRRSGPALYKPDNWTSCCPLLSIRLPVQEFVPSRSQRKLLKKANNHNNNLVRSAVNGAPATSSASPQILQQSASSDSMARPNRKKHKSVPLSRPNNGDHRTVSSNSLVEGEQIAIQESGILDSLSLETRQVLSTLLLGDNTAKMPAAIAFKLRKPTTQRKTLKQFSTSSSSLSSKSTRQPCNQWTAVTTVCAAIAGPSRGAIDKAQLSNDLAQGLRQGCRHLFLSSCVSTAAADSAASKAAPVLIQTIEPHAASGHVIVQLNVDVSLLLSERMGRSTSLENGGSSNHSSASMEALQKNRNNSSSSSSPAKDPLFEWWISEHSKNGKIPPPLSDRTITVDTMNAFDSCLDPDVHQLYALYQKVVHNDPDPFCDDVDKFMESEEAAADGQDPWSAFVSRNPKGLPMRYQGEEGKDVWLNRIKHDLEKLYQQLPERRRLRLHHFVARFCEYYVASHFCTTQQQLSVTSHSTRSSSTTRANIPCGTYHQHYRIQGRLIAVGVLDVLPQGLSSVYLFYHPSFSHNVFALGKYCALREIEYCRDTLHLPYYYLGYYMHSNSKMSYKADYVPSELLCPQHYVWVPVKEAIPRLLERSPNHHCAPIVEKDSDPTTKQEGGSGSNKSNSAGLPHTSIMTDIDDDGLDAVVENMHLQVNGSQFKVRDLADEGQAYLKPLLKPFCAEAGSFACLECSIELGSD